MLRRNANVTGLSHVAALVAALSAVAVFSAPCVAEQITTGASKIAAPGNDLDTIFAAQPCRSGKTLAELDAPIARLSKRLELHEPVTIVALGSSSTAGAGASSPAFSYPSRLERELRHRFPDEKITVVNRGVNGEEASDMMTRLDEVLNAKPDLVLWQAGTNALLRDHPISEVGNVLQAGITRIRERGSDVLLIDPQFTPAVNRKPLAADMVTAIGTVAKRMHVALFRRYAAMRHWSEDQALPFERFVTPDGLHMNDWGYACFARLLADNMASAVNRSRAVADVKPQIQ